MTLAQLLTSFSTMTFRPALAFLLVTLSLAPSVFSKKGDPKKLVPYATFSNPAINESSAIVRSRQFEDVYWTLNDSGDSARIFAVTRNGKAVQTKWASESKQSNNGIPIASAVNIDWESISTDDSGNLLIGAFGNNENARRDLAIYIVPEPDPRKIGKTRARRRIDFHYPDQTKFPDRKNKNFDCEALFFANGKAYLLSKHRSNTRTKLYRLDATEPLVSNELTLLDSFEAKEQVTGADATPDGRKLAVLTYAGCWVFIAPEGSDNYFNGEAYYKPFKARQCEAICWNNKDSLIVTNEQKDLFELTFENWERIR